jgi:uncharacterized protein (PEP-CTERM system associated)
MTRLSFGLLAALAAIGLAAAPSASAQDEKLGSAGAPPDSHLPAGGWTIAPSLLYSANWDDNVLLKQRADEPRGDFLNVLNPRVDAALNGRRAQFSGSYDGAFLLYRDLNTLNSYDQHGSISSSRQLSKHVRLFVNDILAVSPTTELALLVGVPFIRTGVRLNDLRGGVDAQLTKRTSITATYHFEWVEFDQNTAFGSSLFGGHTNGGSAIAKHKLSERSALTFDYDRQFSVMGGVAVPGGVNSFDVQNVSAGFERQMSEALRIYAAAGISRLSAQTTLGAARFGPRYHAGISQRLRTGSLDAVYDRSFTAAYGFIGATESSDLSVRLHMPLWRRIYTQSSFSWRSNSYLELGGGNLQSRWVDASIGYQAQPWVRIEGFYGGAYQTTILPGGGIDRNRVGVQVVTVKPMRIR